MVWAFSFLGVASGLVAATPAPATVTISGLEQSYTGLSHEVIATVAPEGSGPYTFVTTYNGKRTPPVNAGTYTVKVTATSATHKGTATAKLVVRKVPLTVTADNKGRLYGAANPVFTLTYDGFVNGETSAVIKNKPSGIPTAKSTSPAGVYAINVTGGSATNYEFVRVPGSLTIMSFAGGAQEALLGDPFTGEPVGRLDLALPAKGDAYTGILHLAAEAKSAGFKGKLDDLAADYSSVGGAVDIRFGANVYRLELTLGAGGVVTPSLTLDEVPVAEIVNPAALVAYTKTAPAPWKGSYTLVLADPSTSDFRFDYPWGATTAGMALADSGVLKITGYMADGSLLTASLKPSANGAYRLFVRPHGARANSFLGGAFKFIAHPEPAHAGQYYISPGGSDEDTRMTWRKEPRPDGEKRDASYPEGFGPLDYSVNVDPWLPPVAAKKGVVAITVVERLGLSPDEKGAGAFEITHGNAGEAYGDYEYDLPSVASLSAKGGVTPLFDPGFKSRAKWKMTVTTSTGRFSGSFVLRDEVVSDSGATKNISRTVTFGGVLRQAPAGDVRIGVGHLILPPLPSDPVPFSISGELSLRPLEE